MESIEVAQLKIANSSEIPLVERNNKIWKAKVNPFANTTPVSCGERKPHIHKSSDFPRLGS